MEEPKKLESIAMSFREGEKQFRQAEQESLPDGYALMCYKSIANCFAHNARMLEIILRKENK